MKIETMEIRDITSGTRKKILIMILIFFSNQSFAQQEDFMEFLDKFSNDSTFQIQRTLFPLKKIIVNNETFELDTIQVLMDDSKFKRFFYELYCKTDAYPIVYDNFENRLEDSNERVFRWKGFTDMDERYYFKREDGDWFLIKTEILGL